MIIYKITTKINGKSYIGQTTKSFEIRKSAHIRESKYNRRNLYFYNSIRKYGFDNFDWEILEECSSIEDLNLAEEWYIRYFDTYNNGYNLNFGGENHCGYKASKEARKKMSESRKGIKHHFYGKVHPNKGKKIHTEKFKEEVVIWLKKANIGRKLSEDHKRKLSKSLKGRKFTEEHKRKISEANRNRIITDETKEKLRIINTGKKLSESTKEKISVTGKGRKHSDETKEKMSQAKKKNWENQVYRNKISQALSGENNPMYGKKHSEETREKISQALKNKICWRKNGNSIRRFQKAVR